jgi:hypothetical protein
MHTGHISVQLALWASTAHAFYPYRPEWLERMSSNPDDSVRAVDERSAESATFNLKQKGSQVCVEFAMVKPAFLQVD